MTLEQLVASRPMSERLVKAGVAISDSALVWLASSVWGKPTWYLQVRRDVERGRADPVADRMENGATLETRGLVILPAPTMAELKDYQTKGDDHATTEWWANVVATLAEDHQAYLEQHKTPLPQIVASDAVPPGEVLAVGPDDNGELTGTLLILGKKAKP